MLQYTESLFTVNLIHLQLFSTELSVELQIMTFFFISKQYSHMALLMHDSLINICEQTLISPMAETRLPYKSLVNSSSKPRKWFLAINGGHMVLF